MSLDIAFYSPLDEAIRGNSSTFWDDIGTPGREGEAEVWGQALRAAWADLQTLSPEADGQRLDRVRHLTFPHAFAKAPILGPLFSVGPVRMAGDGATINVAKADPGHPGEVLFAPSCRAVFTPGDWTKSRLTLPLGQSGHRLSPYRSDQLADWLGGASHPMPWGGPAPGAEIGILTLRP